MRTIRLTILCLVLFHPAFSQQPSEKEIRDAAIELIADALFEPQSPLVRSQHKAFERRNQIKLQFTVEDASLDKLGGLSEHLFKIYKTIISPVNVNARTITGEFSLLNEGVLSDLVKYRSAATADLRSCQLPLAQTDKMDSLYTWGLSQQSLDAGYLNDVPQSIDELLVQAGNRYEEIIASNPDCDDLAKETYDSFVHNSTASRATNWENDVTFIRAQLSLKLGLLSNENITVAPVNNGNSGVAVNINPSHFKGSYIVNLNNSVNACTERDMEMRCRMLFEKTGIRFIFLTHSISYFIPRDSLYVFRDAATAELTNNLNEKHIIALYLKMSDDTTGRKGTELLVQQLNENWLSNADINFAKRNNGLAYNSGTYWRFTNLFKNIPKPLIICHQVAKVNGLLTTFYSKIGENIKGREQIYYHDFQLDAAFESLSAIQRDIKNQKYASAKSDNAVLQNFDRRIKLENDLRISFLQALHNPRLNRADVMFKDYYLGDEKVAEAGAAVYLKSKGYNNLYQNSCLNDYNTDLLPSDLHQGTCISQDESDVVGTILDISSLLLMPAGLDLIPDALSVLYYAALDKQDDLMLSCVNVMFPGNVKFVKKALGNTAEVFDGVKRGHFLTKESGSSNLVLLSQEVNQLTAMIKFHPSKVSSEFAQKISAHDATVQELLSADLFKVKIYSNASEHLPEEKRFEFINKYLDDASFRNKVLSDPDEVLRWGGKGIYGKTRIAPSNGFSDNITSLASNQGLSLESFKVLQEKAASALSETEKFKIENIRNSIPNPSANTLMQKTIPKADIAKYTSGQYSSFKGFMSTTADSKHLNTFEDIYYGMRLDYPDSKFKLADGSCGVIRFKANNSSLAYVPKDLPNPEPFPFTNHGFTGGTNGKLGVPEWKMDDFVELQNGAELWEVYSDGSEILKAVFNKDLNKFIAIQQ